jgi:hypothetical protein
MVAAATAAEARLRRPDNYEGNIYIYMTQKREEQIKMKD